jgi:uncharacterized protein (DUF2062 family)
MKPAKNNFFLNILRKSKISFLKIYYARGNAHEIALGAAIGAFWGVFPTFGLSTILTLLLYKFIRFNLFVAISAAFISNPITSPFWLMTSYLVGNYFLKSNFKFKLENWTESIPQIGYSMALGATLVSSFTAILIYYIVKFTINSKQKMKSANAN